MASTKDQSEKTENVDMASDNDKYEVVTPLVIEMGKLSRKKLKAFKKGKGSLTDEIVEVLGEVAGTITEETETRTLVPIVMVYEKKPKRKRKFVLPF